MTTTLRYLFILFVLWLVISIVQVPLNFWLDGRIHGCVIAFALERHEQTAVDYFLCNSYDIIKKWGWLLVITSSMLIALVLTFLFRRKAA